MSGDFDSDYELFVSSLIETAKKIFKLTKGNIFVKFSKPWWNEECAEAVREKHRAKNYYKRHPTMDHYEIFKEKEKIASNIVFKAKELSFRKFINSINSETTSKEVWGKLNALSKKKNFTSTRSVYL